MTANKTTMTEKEILTDLLNEEKALVTNYANDVTESACTSLRQLLINNLSECSQDQFTVFEQMRVRNMYKTKEAPTQDVQTAQQNSQNLKQQTGM